MAQIIELTLPFKTEEQKELRHDGRKVIWEYMGITMLEPTKKAGKDPCAKCWAKGLCDAWECGRKLFPIDVKEIY